MNYRSFQKARNGFIAPVSYRANPIPCGGLSPFAKTSELAKNSAISEAALYSAFHKASDVTLNQHRNNLLLEKAKDILISTDKPIEYISDVLRFSSTSYFRKKFKQYFNMTPTEMRKLYRI